MKIETKPIQTELEQLLNPVVTNKDEDGGNGTKPRNHIKRYEHIKVKLDKKMPVVLSIAESDCHRDGFIPGYYIKLNPSRIRTQKHLDEVLNRCRLAIAG